MQPIPGKAGSGRGEFLGHVQAFLRAVRVCVETAGYSAMLSCFEKGSQWQLAIWLFHSMPSSAVLPDLIIYNTIISSCEKGRGLAKILTWGHDFATVQDFDLGSCMWLLSWPGGQWQLAMHLFDALPTAKLAPDVISYNAAISSCEKLDSSLA